MSAFATLSDREIITRVHNDIVRHQTWCMYSALLFTGPVEISTTETPTAATDGWTVWYNPQFLRNLGMFAPFYVGRTTGVPPFAFGTLCAAGR